MPDLVADASVIAPWCFNEARTTEARVALSEATAIAAPRLLPYELANIAWKKALRAPHAVMAIRAGLRVGLALSVYLTDVDAEAVFAMARATGLTAYDASYLHLAQDLGSPLATFDGPLSQAARQLGLLR